MTNQTQTAPAVFQFKDNQIRVIIKDDEPWFVAKDICDVIGIDNPRDAITRLDDDEKGVGLTDTLGGAQSLNIISESGMYALVLRSRDAMQPGTPQHTFRKWVTAEVLPQIRKTGAYSTLKPKEELCYMEHRLKLIDKLYKKCHHLQREQLYAQLQKIDQILHLPTPNLDDFSLQHHDNEMVMTIIERANALLRDGCFLDAEQSDTVEAKVDGYLVNHPDGDLYYVSHPVFKEKIVKNSNEIRVKEILHEAGLLQKNEEKRWVKQLYGKSSNGGRKRLGRFLVFIGIEPKEV